jgi:predicted XRE-type DNA-binding protein
MKTKSEKKSRAIARGADEIGDLLGFSQNEITLMEYKADVSRIAIHAMENCGLSINEIVVLSGVSRSKVSAVKNGATASISIDLLLRIITATGTKVIITAA